MSLENSQHIKKTELQYTYIAVEKITPYAKNAKLHPAKQIRQIANSINQFGFISPIIVSSEGEVVAGHGRLEAAKLLGLEKVPVVSVEHLTEAEIKAYRLADNQLTMNSGYDYGLLKIELAELNLQTYFDIEITGFETAEIDIIIDGDDTDPDDPADALPEVDETAAAVTKSGDIWLLGKHKLICADATQEETFGRLMNDD